MISTMMVLATSNDWAKVTKGQGSGEPKQACDNWVKSNDNGQNWLETHGFYEGACDAVRKLVGQPGKTEGMYVVTTSLWWFFPFLILFLCSLYIFLFSQLSWLFEKQQLFKKAAPYDGISEDSIFVLWSLPEQKILGGLL